MPGSSSLRRRALAAAVAAAALGATMLIAPPAAAAAVLEVAVSQAGYSAGSDKVGYAVADAKLPGGTACRILQGPTVVVPACTLLDRGVTWNRHVYVVEFGALDTVGTGFTLEVGGVASPAFEIADDIWDSYLDEMTAFYRIQRAGVATEDVYPAGYSSIAPSPGVFHEAAHLDDAASEDGTTSYTLTGGWYDAGDYGKYAGNQWVGGLIAISYLRHGTAPEVAFDGDANGVPDLLDEARFGSEYLIRFADAFDGALYDIKGSGGFAHPEHHTDGVPGTGDDRRISGLGIGGSAKAAGTLAATARAVAFAIAEGHVDAGLVAELETFAALCESTAVDYYEFALANADGPIGSYSTRDGIANSLLFAETELALLTGEAGYRTAAEATVAATQFDVRSSTNYWDLAPLSMAELHPIASPTARADIQAFLKHQLDYILSSVDDTPYGVVNQFKNFGVNEPHASYMADALRYYELFGDQRALKAVLRGTYWMFGANPWNTSWVSGVGERHVRFLHTRLDEQAQNQAGTGIVLPGALVSGPNAKDPLDPRSTSPWYEDRPVWADSGQQWRYNEYSISIQTGLLSTIVGLADIGGAPTSAGTPPTAMNVTSPLIGDEVTGDVTVFAQSGASLGAHALGPDWSPMTGSGGVSTGTVNVDGVAPYTTARIDVRGTQASGAHSYGSTHYTVAPPLPAPDAPLLYDGFGRDGTFGTQGYTWANWWNNHAGVGSASNTVIDGRTAGRFVQNPATDASQAKFQPWHDVVDLSGYRYVTVVMKSPTPGNRVRFQLADADSNHRISGPELLAVPDTWTSYDFDLDAFPGLDRSAAKMELWLQQTADVDGELHVDSISFTNRPSGSAPGLDGLSVSTATGSTSTDFVFRAEYADADGQPPHAVQLVVDGVVRTMAPVDASDDYLGGVGYELAIRLPKGVHSWYVRTSDTTSPAVQTPVQLGPTVS